MTRKCTKKKKKKQKKKAKQQQEVCEGGQGVPD